MSRTDRKGKGKGRGSVESRGESGAEADLSGSGAEIVVNLHVTERCNYRCSFCFGKWGIRGADDPGADGGVDGVFGDPGRAFLLVSDVFRLLSVAGPSSSTNIPVRFNFAGGEPALLRTLPEVVEYCRSLGATTSFVSNGLMLRRFGIPWLARNFDLVGLSVDSAVESTNLRIGRATSAGRVFDIGEIVSAVRALRSVSDCPVKINTVVNRKNVYEDLSPALRDLAPEKWKVLQMLPVYDSTDEVTADEFQAFVHRHAEFADIMTVEDNDQMTASYLMIDPLGRFFWTTDSEGRSVADATGYVYSRPILEVGAAAAYRECEISWAKYARRY
ncbi:hypothetical protein OK074_6438 [Actinobacteria bacterium OK074]|nr:hypothetical protein OK074_6438 [Actinobacteria bacterium OK074]